MTERLLVLAREVHAEWCDCDDKSCMVTNEIYEWLAEGEPVATDVDLDGLVEEWDEYYYQNDRR